MVNGDPRFEPGADNPDYGKKQETLEVEYLWDKTRYDLRDQIARVARFQWSLT